MIYPNPGRGFQKNRRSAAEGLSKEHVQTSAAFRADVFRQFIRLILRCCVGCCSCAIEAVKADSVDGIILFQQRNYILKLLLAHQVSVQHHDPLSVLVAEFLNFHIDTPYFMLGFRQIPVHFFTSAAV